MKDDSSFALLDFVCLLIANWRRLIFVPLGAGLLALGITYLIPPTFTSRTVFLPPQQQQSAAASALASLGALSGLAGVAGGIRSPIDQYVALMESALVQDRIIDEFKLMEVYESDYRVDARKELGQNVRISAGRRDGLITVEVDDKDPERAAAMANRYVEQLRRVTSQLALTEAQQRRAFFQEQLSAARENLTKAQLLLQSSGFDPGALKAEPKAAADRYARLRAEVTAAEVRLHTLRQRLADTTLEVQQQLSLVAALRTELTKLESSVDVRDGAGYISKYREFKYQETLYELFAKQFEIARLDESREGALTQVVDVARPAEKKSKPRRAVTAVVTTVIAFLLAIALLVIGDLMRRSQTGPGATQRWSRIRRALHGS
ncbi:MAG: lipopolysaccharide biosynthesis protein [Ideonella sp. WA131b]|nr:lipopolysaccharide biosynthesis protein [Ideonella sp. WA131b]